MTANLLTIEIIWGMQSLGVGSTQYKRPYRDVPPTWVAKSASWYLNDPLKNAKFGI